MSAVMPVCRCEEKRMDGEKQTPVQKEKGKPGRRLGSKNFTPWLRDALAECYTREEWQERFRALDPEAQFNILVRLEPKDHFVSGAEGGPITIRFLHPGEEYPDA